MKVEIVWSEKLFCRSSDETTEYIVGRIGIMTLFYIIKRCNKPDLFTPPEEYWELNINGCFTNPDIYLGDEGDFDGYYSYEGTLEECKLIAEETLLIKDWDEFRKSKLFDKVIKFNSWLG